MLTVCCVAAPGGNLVEDDSEPSPISLFKAADDEQAIKSFAQVEDTLLMLLMMIMMMKMMIRNDKSS